MPARSSLGMAMLFYVIDGLAYRLDFLGLFVGDGDVKLFLKLHHQFHGVERVGPEVVDKGGLPGDLVLGDSHLFADDFYHALFHGHGPTSSCTCIASRPSNNSAF